MLFLTAGTAVATAPVSLNFVELGDVKYNYTGPRAKNFSDSDKINIANFYGSALDSSLINQGVSVLDSDLVSKINQIRQENDQLNQGRGGLFDGQYKKYGGDLPPPAYKLETTINVWELQETGKNDINVNVRIIDTQTGEIVGHASTWRRNTDVYLNEKIIGPQPTWWEKYITGYVREITFDDAIKMTAVEAAKDIYSQLGELGVEGAVPDAERFSRRMRDQQARAKALAESGYQPLVPDEVRNPKSASGKSSSLEDAYFGTNDGLMPRACEAILAKMTTWERQTNSDGGIVPHGWEEFIKDGKNSGGVTDLGTCSTNIIFEERDKEDMRISIRGFDVTRERNEEYQKASKDTKYVDGFYMPMTKDEIYEKWKKDWIELGRNQSAENNKFTDIFEGKGFVSTYYFDSDKEIPDPSIDSYALILSGKCVVSFSGFSWPIRDGDLYEERIVGPQGRSLLKRQGRWSGLYGKYHYYEYSYDGKGDYVDREAINVHPGFDHGFEELHQKMISLAPQIVEAIKPFCE